MLPSPPAALSSSLRCLSFFSHEAPHLVHLNLGYIQVSHELVVDGFGVVPNQLYDPSDGVTGHSGETCCLPTPDTLGQVLHDVEDPGLREAKIE
jgi:hypothetical protein